MSKSEKQGPDPHILGRAVRLLIAVQGIAIAPLLVWSVPISDQLLGEEYRDSASVLQALAPYAFMMGISPMLAMSVNYLGEAKRRIPIAFIALGINVVINYIFLPRIGIVAAAIGTDIAYGVYLLAHLYLLRSLMGLQLIPLLSTFLRTSIAALAMAGTLLAFDLVELSLPVLVLGAVVSTAVYAVALVATGAISRAELREIVSRLRPA